MKNSLICKRTIIFLLLHFLNIFIAYSDELPSVALRPIVHENSAQTEQLASTVEDIIKITLTLMKDFDYKKIDYLQWEKIASNSDAVTKLSVDNIISGKIIKEEGIITVSLSVYNGLEDRYTVNVEESADGFLAVFDITDSLILKLLEGFTRKRLAFGSIRFKNYGEKRDYQIIVDGKEIGYNISLIEKIFEGSYKLDVHDKVTGNIVFSGNIDVHEGIVTEAGFSIPYLHETERTFFEGIDGNIKSQWEVGTEKESISSELSIVDDFIINNPEREFSLLENKYKLLLTMQKKKNFGGHKIVTVVELSPEEDMPDWELIPIFIEADSNSPKGRSPLPPEGTPGADIEYVKVARDLHATKFFFNIHLANGSLNKKLSYKFSLTKDNIEYYNLSVKFRDNRWKLEPHIWSRVGDGDDFPVRSKVFTEGSDIEVEIDLTKTSIGKEFKQILMEGYYWAFAKTQQSEPFHDYEITASKRISLLSRFTNPLDVHIQDIVDIQNLYIPSISSGRLNEITNGITVLSNEDTHFLPYHKIKVDGKVLDWSGLSPVVKSDAWRDDSSNTSYNLEELYLARDDKNLYMRVDFEGEIINFTEDIIFELLIFGNKIDESKWYRSELRVYNGETQIHIRKTPVDYWGEKTEGVERFDNVGSMNYNTDSNIIELSFPLKKIAPYMEREMDFKAVFHIWNLKEHWEKSTDDFRIILD
ncbi:MAG: hypothetical protein U9N32_02135 [Spirochaetota bacterium]|nr:hypothetical protein [Spirochaetota bacterium]